jgi:hypothetical protein
MSQKILDNIFLHITGNLILYLGLWFVFTSGWSFSTGITESQLNAFWSTSYYIAILSIVATLIGRWTTVQPKAYLSSSVPKNIFLKLLRSVQNLFWLIVDILNWLFWLIFDSWRKPSVELFALMSTYECTKAMVDACKKEISVAELKNQSPITGYFGKSYFSLFKWSPTPPSKLAASPSTILYGKVYNVKKGVFIRAWYRLPSSLLIFIGIWFGALTHVIVEFVRMEISYLPNFAFLILKILGTICWLLFFMWISTKFAREAKHDLKVFLENTFSSKP